MIAEIDPPSEWFNDIIDYHERKVDEGKAQLLVNNTFEEDRKKYAKAFESVCENNLRVKNRCFHISINFPVGENISNDKLVQIANEYLDKMDFNDSPYLIYKHEDKKHSHIHIVLSAVTFEGKKINDSFNHPRSQVISREIEEKYNLIKTIYHDFSNKSLNQYNAETYNFVNALKRANKDPKAKAYVESKVTKEELAYFYKNSITNLQASAILQERFEDITNYLHKGGYFTAVHKTSLLQKLDKIYDISKTKDEFFQNIEKEGIYFRQVSDKGRTRYVYGVPEQSAYFKDSRLPKKYSFFEISNHFGPFKGIYIPESEQKHIVYNLIVSSVKESESVNDFVYSIKQGNVDVEKVLNPEGKITDFEFTFRTEKNTNTFKFTELLPNVNIDYFTTKLMEKENSLLDENTFKRVAIESSSFYPDNSIYIPSTPMGFGSKEDYSFEKAVLKKKKKKRSPQQDVNQNL